MGFEGCTDDWGREGREGGGLGANFTLRGFLEVLELLVPGQSLLLAHSPVDGNCWEVLLNQKLRQGHATLHRLDEDDHLVELQHIEKLKEFPVLLRVLQLDIVLPQ